MNTTSTYDLSAWDIPVLCSQQYIDRTPSSSSSSSYMSGSSSNSPGSTTGFPSPSHSSSSPNPSIDFNSPEFSWIFDDKSVPVIGKRCPEWSVDELETRSVSSYGSYYSGSHHSQDEEVDGESSIGSHGSPLLSSSSSSSSSSSKRASPSPGSLSLSSSTYPPTISSTINTSSSSSSTTSCPTHKKKKISYSSFCSKVAKAHLFTLEEHDTVVTQFFNAVRQADSLAENGKRCKRGIRLRKCENEAPNAPPNTVSCGVHQLPAKVRKPGGRNEGISVGTDAVGHICDGKVTTVFHTRGGKVQIGTSLSQGNFLVFFSGEEYTFTSYTLPCQERSCPSCSRKKTHDISWLFFVQCSRTNATIVTNWEMKGNTSIFKDPKRVKLAAVTPIVQEKMLNLIPSCRGCGMGFASLLENVHHECPELTCGKCHASFDRFSDMKKHMCQLAQMDIKPTMLPSNDSLML